MTVKELKEILIGFPDEANVHIEDEKGDWQSLVVIKYWPDSDSKELIFG